MVANKGEKRDTVLCQLCCIWQTSFNRTEKTILITDPLCIRSEKHEKARMKFGG